MTEFETSWFYGSADRLIKIVNVCDGVRSYIKKTLSLISQRNRLK